MEDQELEKMWKQVTEPGIQVQSSRIASDLDANLLHFKKEIRMRNLRETLAGIVVFIAFSAGAYVVPGLLSKIGSALCAAYGLIIVVVVNYINTPKEADYTLSLKEYLLSQRVYLLRERKLLSTVLYWYILPPTISVLVFFAGIPLTTIAYITCSSLIIGMNTVVLVINKITIKKTVDPLLLQLNQSISQLEQPN